MSCILCFQAFIYIMLFACASAECPPERPGQCNESPAVSNDTEVYPACTANCDFTSDLCYYRQACLDTGMTEWTAASGQWSAQADQTAGGCGRQSFSMLESPPVHITSISCLTFKFTRHLPYDLAVFLQADDNNVTTLFNGSTELKSGAVYTYKYPVQKQVAQLLFRLYGGGGYSGNGTRQLLQLDYISLQPGSCDPPVCNFSNEQPDIFCGWYQVNWQPSNASGIRAIDTTANLTTGYTRPTEETRVDCLEFRYLLFGSGTSLNVSVQLLDGPKVTLWSWHGNGSQMWQDAMLPISSTNSSYQIVFESHKSQSSEEISLANVTVSVTSMSSCNINPPEASTNEIIAREITCLIPSADTTTRPSTSQSSTEAAIAVWSGVSTELSSSSSSTIPSKSITTATITLTNSTSESSPSPVIGSSSQPSPSSPTAVTVSLATSGTGGSAAADGNDEGPTKAIIAVVVVIGVLLIALVIFVIFLFRRKSKMRPLEENGGYEYVTPPTPYEYLIVLDYPTLTDSIITTNGNGHGDVKYRSRKGKKSMTPEISTASRSTSDTSAPAKPLTSQSIPATLTPVTSTNAPSTSHVAQTPATSTPTASTTVASTPVSSTPVMSAPTTSNSTASTLASSEPTTSKPAISTDVDSKPITHTPVTTTSATSAPVTSTPVTSTLLIPTPATSMLAIPAFVTPTPDGTYKTVINVTRHNK